MKVLLAVCLVLSGCSTLTPLTRGERELAAQRELEGRRQHAIDLARAANSGLLRGTCWKSASLHNEKSAAKELLDRTCSMRHTEADE